jgi:hypothetical protein
MGYDNDFSVDESVLGFILKIDQSVKFNFAQFLSNKHP